MSLCERDRPGMAPSEPQKGAHVGTVDTGPRPVDRPGRVEANQQALVQGLPDAGPLPVA